MLKKLFLALAVVTTLSGVSMDYAEAKRLGGGGNTGMQRQAPAQRAATPPQAAPQQPGAMAPQAAARPAAAPAAPPAAQPSGWRKWAGPVAALAAGIGLSALMSHLGMGAEFGTFLLMALGGILLVVVLKKLFSRNATPQQPAYAGNAANVQNMNDYRREEAPAQPAQGNFFNSPEPTPAQPAHAASAYPAGFDVDTFVRQAKVNFIRLQAANDAADLADIRDFTTPEMFAEIKVAIDERRGAPQKTDVVMLDAEVIEVVEERGNYVVSVRYFGSLREEAGGAPQAFNELWHLTKPIDGNRGWTLAGIQQVQ